MCRSRFEKSFGSTHTHTHISHIVRADSHVCFLFTHSTASWAGISTHLSLDVSLYQQREKNIISLKHGNVAPSCFKRLRSYYGATSAEHRYVVTFDCISHTHTRSHTRTSNARQECVCVCAPPLNRSRVTAFSSVECERAHLAAIRLWFSVPLARGDGTDAALLWLPERWAGLHLWRELSAD